MGVDDEDLSALPPKIRALVEDADRVHKVLEEKSKNIWDLFVPSDFVPVWRTLQEVPRGSGFFLEWGSGLGTVALMAAALGFTAYGIDINAELVEQSREIAARHDLTAHFVVGTFFPAWYEDNPQAYDEDMRSYAAGEDGYDKLGLGLEDMDVIYVFPWPGEEAVLHDIFERGARPGSHLIINHGHDGLKVTRHR